MLSVRVGVTPPIAGASPSVTSLFGGALTLTIPGGASTAPQLTVGLTATPKDDRSVANAAYVFGPEGSTFSTPLTLAIKFDPAVVAAADRSQLWLASFDAAGAASPLSASTVDLAAGTVTSSISHFSTYGVIKLPTPVALPVETVNATGVGSLMTP